MSQSEFLDLISRAKQGCQDACTELVNRFAPIIRRTVRHKMSSLLSAKLGEEDVARTYGSRFSAAPSNSRRSSRQPT